MASPFHSNTVTTLYCNTICEDWIALAKSWYIIKMNTITIPNGGTDWLHLGMAPGILLFD
jgi:hypothetical protein